MADSKKYKVIVSDRTKRMLETHIRFMAQSSPMVLPNILKR